MTDALAPQTIGSKVARSILQIARPTTNVIVVPEQHDGQFVRKCDKSETPRQPGATLEDITLQLPNAEPAVDMRIPEGLAKFEQGHDRADLLSVGQRAQLLLDGGG